MSDLPLYRTMQDDEIDQLKAQLKETEEKGRVLIAMCRDLIKARVAELERDNAHQRERRNADRDCIQKMKAETLRKQAEAVEQAKYEHALTARQPDGTAGQPFQDGFYTAAEQYDTFLDRYAQRLRQQADEAERAGGE